MTTIINKRRHNAILFVICGLSLCMTFFACSDDDDAKGDASIPEPIISQVELSRTQAFYEFSISGGGNWQVTQYPEWATPMSDEGNEGEPLQLFVESYVGDLDRTDTIIVESEDLAITKFALKQHGLQTSQENSYGNNITNKDLMNTYGVGYTVDVFDNTTESPSKYIIKDFSPINFSRLNKALKTLGEPDAMYDEPRYSSYTESVTGTSTTALANQLAVNAGIEVGISAFKFSVEGGYSGTNSSNDKYVYALQEIQHIVGSRYLRAGVLRHFAEGYFDEPTKTNVFQTNFRELVNELRENPDNKEVMYSIVETYGTHIVTHGTLGGELKVSMQMRVTDQTSSSDINAALELSAKVVDVNGNFTMSNKEKAIANNTSISLRSYGGHNVYTISPGATFESFQEQMRDEAKMNSWSSTILPVGSENAELALIDADFTPIYDLMPTEQLRTALHNYIIDDYQKLVYANDTTYTGTTLYMVTGYDAKSDVPGKGSIYFDDIDVQIDVERMDIPSLSTTELSTVIFSGEKDNVNHTRGFFVGSPTRKPCKFRVNGDGSYTVTETFDLLATGDIIEEVYVDATGDVTIAPKNALELYQEKKMGWKKGPKRYNLNIIDGDISVRDSCVLTGSTAYRVVIEDNTCVTLYNAMINGGVMCKGNAKIVLAEGTENTVSVSTRNCAIQAGSPGTTLTITGSGKLTAQGGEYCPAIGANSSAEVGNIIIENGIILANGDEYAAAIGTSYYNSTCGNITITGGQVTANGGAYAAAIGAAYSDNSPYNSTCGNITITGGQVTAKAGLEGAGIGSGYAGRCGDILISGGIVTAYSGPKKWFSQTTAASIGTSISARCGNITIRNTVKQVSVDSDNNYRKAIGAGYQGECGTVYIESGTNIVYR